MPSLEVNRQLRLKYDYNLKKGIQVYEHLNIKNDDSIEKAISDSSMELLQGDYKKYFLNGESAPVYLMFIDICKFSTRYSHFTGNQISAYFDSYYDIVIPIIYQYGGVIDKIMGDGIIVIFGQPFINTNEDECFELVDLCARSIIIATSNTNAGRFSSKIAIVYGDVSYYNNKSLEYNEYTIVGPPLTQLFRLETVAVDNSVCFFSESNVADKYADALKFRTNSYHLKNGLGFLDDMHRPWGIHEFEIPPLTGVRNQKAIFSIKLL